ncbi:Histone acetyltransferase protein [Dioscorea alata]|nr:Histone acetyltransferase protein [Dioscorea alata]
MPLIGTRVKYRQQGMCRLLVNELEKLLSSLGVEMLILPAIPELVQTWTTKFGFTKMSNSDRLKLKDYMFLNFLDSTMCYKFLAGNENQLTSNETNNSGNASVEAKPSIVLRASSTNVIDVCHVNAIKCYYSRKTKTELMIQMDRSAVQGH